MTDSINHLIAANRFELGYAAMIVADIPDERFCEQPFPGVNHPAWILSHLINTADSISVWLGGSPVLKDEVKKNLGMGSTPSTNRADYPSKEELLKQLRETHERFYQLVANATEEQLQVQNPITRMQAQLPTLREAITFILVGHVGIHLGQLSAWRRLIGLPALF